MGSHPAFKPTQGLQHLFIARGIPRRLKARKVLEAASAWHIPTPLPQTLTYSEAVVRGSTVVWRDESTKMTVGNHGGRGREDRVPGAAGPYRRDRGVLNAVRSWGGRDDWARRGGASHDDYRGARAGRHGGFGRGGEGMFQRPGLGRGGPPNASSGRWVWQEDRRGAALLEKGNGDKGGAFEATQQIVGAGAGEVMASSSGGDPGAVEEFGGSQDGGDAAMAGGRCSRC